MEAIKNYLEAMFANLPNTEAVRKAKKELAQMMEDKYNELIAEGSTENEAVGAVISGFGNLDDLADELGLTEEVKEEKEQGTSRRKVSFDEASAYITDRSRQGFLVGIGVMAMIASIASVIIAGEILQVPDGVSIGGMFLLIFFGVGMVVYAANSMSKWKFLTSQPCLIDLETTKVIAAAKEDYQKVRAGLLTAGIILCSACWLPAAILSDTDSWGKLDTDNICAALLFVMVGVGVFFIIYSSYCIGSYDKILKLNDTKTVAGAYYEEETNTEKKDSRLTETGRLVMSVYWPTVTCIYFVYSFNTMKWPTSWLIWVAAAAVQPIIRSFFKKK